MKGSTFGDSLVLSDHGKKMSKLSSKVGKPHHNGCNLQSQELTLYVFGGKEPESLIEEV